MGGTEENFSEEIKVRLTLEQRSRLEALARKRSIGHSTLARQAIQTLLIQEDPDYRRLIEEPGEYQKAIKRAGDLAKKLSAAKKRKGRAT